uniref:Uncharacterized protein n=1 Tax=Ixodes ricinus TaxID=34613 RepID=A0A6B0UVI6_IXORI
MQLGDAHGSRLSHVGVLVLQALPQGFAQVLRDLVHADAAHRAHRQRPDQRVAVLAIFYKCVHSHYSHIRLTLCVVHEVQVHQFLQLQVVRLHAVHHVGEESADIFSNCHRSDDLFYCFSLLLLLVAVQFALEFEYLSFLGRREVFGVSHGWLK